MSLQEINAGIVILQDGKTPCIAYDQPLPHPVKAIEFSKKDYNITLVYDVLRKRGTSKFASERPELTFDFPLDPRFADLIIKDRKVALACVKKGELTDLKVFLVTILT